MKKTKKILLVAMLVLAFMINTSIVFATSNGPADVDYAFISLEDSEGEGGYIYAGKTTYNDVMEGVSYDKATNTLTIDNVRGNYAIGANMMGDDFKINVVGENSISTISLWGDGYGANLTITGEGTLDVNKDKETISAIIIHAEETKPVLTIDKTVTVNLYGDKDVIAILGVNDASHNAVVLKNGQKISVVKEEETSEVYEKVQGVMLSEGSEYYIAKNKANGELHSYSKGSIYYVSANTVIYDEDTDIYFEDSTSSDSPFNIQMTEEEFLEAYETVNDERVPVYYGYANSWGYNVAKDAEGNKYVVNSYMADGTIYDILNKVTLSDGNDYAILLQTESDVDPESLTEDFTIEPTGLYNYTVKGTSLEIKANVTAEDPKEENNKPDAQEEVKPSDNKQEETKTDVPSTNPTTDTSKPEGTKPEEQKAPEVKVETTEANTENNAAVAEVTKLVQSVVNGTSVSGIDKELEGKIKTAVAEGKTVNVEVATASVEKTAVAEDAAKVEAKIDSNTKVAAYFDIDVLVKANTDTLGNVTELGDEIQLSVPVPTNLPAVASGYTREYYIIRVHDGVAEELNAKVSGDSIVFSSKLFSTYALAYKDVKVTSTSISPKTGDNVAVITTMLVFAVVGLGTTVVIRKRIQK